MSFDPMEITQAVLQQGAVLEQHASHIQRLDQKLDSITALLQRMQQRLESPRPPATPVPVSTAVPDSTASPSTIKVPLPDKYERNPSLLRGFIHQCSLHFRNQPDHFAARQARITFFVSLLRGRALAWVTPLMDRQSPLLDDFDDFLGAF
ncbi:protein LDOC1-like [Rhinophrynus dorsalis]